MNDAPAPALVIGQHLAWARHCGARPGTLAQREHHLHRLAAWLAASRAPGPGLLEVTAEDLERWQLSFPAEHKANYRASRVSHARAFYTWALSRELVQHRVLNALVAPRREKTLPRPTPVNDLVRALQNAPRRILPWLLLGAYAGLRACEVAPLHTADIDLAAGTLFVVEGKGGKQRMVTLGPELVALLRPFVPHRGYLFPALHSTGKHRGEPIPGSHVSKGQVSHLASAYLAEQDCPSFHALRHRYATDIWTATHDLRLLQELLGWASPATAAIYTLISTDRYVAAAAAVSNGLTDALARPRLVHSPGA